jgi:hypothetical protein
MIIPLFDLSMTEFSLLGSFNRPKFPYFSDLFLIGGRKIFFQKIEKFEDYFWRVVTQK